MKILLVEDDEPLGRSLLQVLTEQGHATMWLRELTPARLHQAADRFDLLLLGIVPPDGSGMELLAMARLEVGALQGNTEQVDVAELARQRLAAMAQLARTRSINLVYEAPEVLISQIDRSGFLSILENLVDNAIRYTPSGGRVEVRLTGGDDGLGLVVRDDGPGIAEADRERVFERFVRLPQATEQGSGLGLAIEGRMVASQTGSLRFAEGLAGRGVGFVVRLPV